MTLSDATSDPAFGEAASLNTLRLALITLRDRCTRGQRRIEELEHETLTLRASKTDLYAEVKRLSEANIKLREKNLALNQKLHRKSRENVEVRDQLNSLQDQHSDSIRQLERLQTEVTSFAFSRSRENLVLSDPLTSNLVAAVEARSAQSDDEIARYNRLTRINSLEEEDDDGSLAAEVRMDTGSPSKSLEASEAQMTDLKSKLLEQQTRIKEAMFVVAHSLKAGKILKGHGEGSSEMTSENVAGAASNPRRTCPMCEADFDWDVEQSVFEAHVVEHFEYEEGETLKNFEVVEGLENNRAEHGTSVD